jgi:hypothetical protein
MTVRRAGLLLSVVLTVLAVPAAATAQPAAPAVGPAAAPGLPGETGAASAGSRAMWLWTGQPPVDVVAWATGHGVSEIFASVPWNVPTSPDLGRLQELKQRTDAAGIRLTALGGDPGWALDHSSAVLWLCDVARTNLFAGVHLDVEPHVLPGWATDPAGTAAEFLDLLDLLARVGEVFDLPLEVDLPFWYGMITLPTGNLAAEVLERVAAVTAMTYRDTATGPNSLIDVGTDLLSRGAAAGKPIRLAAETQPVPGCAHCTFFEEGHAALGTTLAAVDTAAQSWPTFAGIANHHYASWTALTP